MKTISTAQHKTDHTNQSKKIANSIKHNVFSTHRQNHVSSEYLINKTNLNPKMIMFTAWQNGCCSSCCLVVVFGWFDFFFILYSPLDRVISRAILVFPLWWVKCLTIKVVVSDRFDWCSFKYCTTTVLLVFNYQPDISIVACSIGELSLK